MLLNALFPTRDIGSDPAKIRDWAQAAEDMGYHCIEVADHVYGAAPRGDWKPTYSEYDPFHETFTTMAFSPRVNISSTRTWRSCCQSGSSADSPADAQTRSSKARCASMSISPKITVSTPRACSRRSASTMLSS